MTDNQNSVTAGAVQPPTDRPLTAGDVMWLCKCCFTEFQSPQTDRVANGYDDYGTGPSCPKCKAGGVFAWRVGYHQGDPCIHCGSAHDDVAVGPCPMRRPATSAASEEEGVFDLVAHLHRARAFSEKTFGPGARTAGVVDHIRKELREIEADPADVMEWIDVVILAFDGAWRAGWTPEEIVAAIVSKQTKNEARTWPDWRTADPNKAIEHDRSGEAALASPPVSERERELEGVVKAFKKAADPVAIAINRAVNAGPSSAVRLTQAEAMAVIAATRRALTAQPAGEG